MKRIGTTQGIAKEIFRLISSRRLRVFGPSDFAALGNRTAIDQALKRLAKEGRIRRLGRGLYDVPRRHPKLGELWPSVEHVVDALNRKHRTRLLPSAAYAANLLGLSEQVPAKIVFLTDGPTRNVSYGPMKIQFKRTSARNMDGAGRLSGILIQALRHLGEENVTRARIDHLRRSIPLDQRRRLLDDLRLAPVWMHSLFRDIAAGE